MRTRLYTIGHSTNTTGPFVRLLEDNCAMVVVDVRTSPYSRFHPQFGADSLERILPEHGIR